MWRPDEREKVEPGDGDCDRPQPPLPVQPQARVLAAGGEVEHHEDGRDVTEQVNDVVHLEVTQLGLKLFINCLPLIFLHSWNSLNISMRSLEALTTMMTTSATVCQFSFLRWRFSWTKLHSEYTEKL